MNDNLSRELAALQCLRVVDLKARYAQLFGEETQTGNRAWLVKRLAWRLQALAEGGLSERARQRAAELANEADLRLSPPPSVKPTPASHHEAASASPCTNDRRLPPPGTILRRTYKGLHLQVQVREEGFAFDGQVYPSLSAVAKAITGSHCNGFLFFRLTRNGASA
jgi:hypothetical protein